MKTKFKISALIACAALLFSVFNARAQYQPASLLPSVTLAGSTTTNWASNYLIDCTKQQNVALQVDFVQTGPGTSNAVFVLRPSVDGLTFDAVNTITLSVAANGTNPVCWTTNIAANGIGYYKVYSTASPNTSAGTNWTLTSFKWGVKRNAP